jgi:hypothetical protein
VNRPPAPDLPDFYLVGAPKCGTSAMYEFLGQHPEIFVPDTKELLLFATDLSYPTRLSTEAFLAHFAARRGERRSGTAHTAYLQSTRAAAEIKAARPDADIIVMLRNPVEMLPSWHSELLYETIEDIEDFEAALDAEGDRRQGQRVPRAALNSYVESLFYTDVVSFSAQVERYFNVFGRSHVHVILHDDMREDPHAAYRETLRFLGVDPSFAPRFTIVNANKVVRSRVLQRLYFGTAAPGHGAVRRMLPRRVRRRLLKMNARETPRPPLASHVSQRLERELKGEVTRLSELLERDLSHWVDVRGPDRVA